MDDQTFRDAVIRVFFDEAKAQFWAKSINFAFVDGRGSDAMRDFVMHIFLTRIYDDWFQIESRKWPKTFVQKLADHCMTMALSGEKIKSYEEIETIHVGPDGGDEDEVVDLVSADDDDAEDLPLSDLSRSIMDRQSARVT